MQGQRGMLMGALQAVVPQRVELEEHLLCSWDEVETPREGVPAAPRLWEHLCAWPLCCKGRGAAAGGGGGGTRFHRNF